MLADRRLIEKTPRQGYVVRRLNLTEIDELYDMRLVLEAYIMEQVCKAGLDEGERLVALKQRWTQLYEALPEMIADPVKDRRGVSRGLCARGRQSGDDRRARATSSRQDPLRARPSTSPTSTRLKATCVQHLEILEAIGRRDAAKAVDALRRNIEGGRTQVENAFKDALANAYEIYG